MKTQRIDFESALKIYYGTIEIDSRHIRQLFSCGANKAAELKKKALAHMGKLNKMPCISGCVNTEIAFEAWGIDIHDIEKKYKKLKTLGLAAAGGENQ